MLITTQPQQTALHHLHKQAPTTLRPKHFIYIYKTILYKCEFPYRTVVRGAGEKKTVFHSSSWQNSFGKQQLYFTLKPTSRNQTEKTKKRNKSKKTMGVKKHFMYSPIKKEHNYGFALARVATNKDEAQSVKLDAAFQKQVYGVCLPCTFIPLQQFSCKQALSALGVQVLWSPAVSD